MEEFKNMYFSIESDEEGEDPGFVTLMTQDEEDEINKQEFPNEIPILPLRNTVLFPGVVFPITLGRDKAIRLIKDAYKSTKIIGVVAQKDEEIDDRGQCAAAGAGPCGPEDRCLPRRC